MEENYKHSELTGRIIKAYYQVYNELGHGFLEKVYEKAMMIELSKMGLKAEEQRNIKVFYRGTEVGDYYADIIVENCVILELKAVEVLAPEHEVQLVNYLKATEIEVGLLLNFGPEPEFKRRVFSKDYLRRLD
ncbi:GxxExxY protein [Gaoshiqia sp. Z1-71]|uniref:GxxExxY protein n=1 Tax=Gaoshiqia hydrogeniformans TaxID=3290090 RepID=UPI003BF845DF